MPALKSSKTSRISKKKRAAGAPSGAGWVSLIVVFLAIALVSTAAVIWISRHGYTLYYGDAEAHLNIARRIVDSRTPGYAQIGTVWLPLPHWLMLPFIRNRELWRSGLAGAIPSAACFVIAATFMFAAARRFFGALAPAVTVAALFVFNPNLLYLQSTPMTEPVLFAALCGLLYFTVAFHSSQWMGHVAGAGVCAACACLTRYEGWALIPLVTLYFFAAAKRNRLAYAVVFGLIAAAAPLYWLIHNWFYYGNALEFYNGPYSAKAINQRAVDKGMARYPGDHDWRLSWQYFCAAAQMCVGRGLIITGVLGALAALAKRALWPIIFLSVPPLFYVLSMYSSGTPIFVPHLWPNGYYNTRYGLAALPLLAFASGALVWLAPGRARILVAAAVMATALTQWIAYPRADWWICWKESEVNSSARRLWTEETAKYMGRAFRKGDGIVTMFGDMAAIFREADIPFRETTNDCNNPEFLTATLRPDLFLHAKWVLAQSGDAVSTAMLKLGMKGPRYSCVKMVTIKGAPVIEIYEREPVATSIR